MEEGGTEAAILFVETLFREPELLSLLGLVHAQ